jgi:replicative DNA helicase
MTTQDFTQAVFTPQQSVQLAVRAVEKVETQRVRGINFPISPIDEYIAPLLPGQVLSLIAQTSHYKSSFMRFWEREAAYQLMSEKRDDEAIIHVSVEEVVEEQVLTELARESGDKVGDLTRGQVQDWAKLRSAAVRVGHIPIYRIGESLAMTDDVPNLYLSNMIRALKALVNGDVLGKQVNPALLVFDYLQAFPIDPEVRSSEIKNQRRLQVRNDIYRLRKAAARFNCPVIVGVQAKQQLSGASGQNFLAPGMYDGEESSSIAQRSDRILSLWMPARTHIVGEWLTHKDLNFQANEDLLWLRVLKQRGSLPAGKTFALQIDHDRNDVRPMDISSLFLDGDL